jgi:hypothetical protein
VLKARSTKRPVVDVVDPAVARAEFDRYWAISPPVTIPVRRPAPRRPKPTVEAPADGLHSVPTKSERDRLANAWVRRNPGKGRDELAAYLTGKGHPISGSAARQYLPRKTAV